MHIYYNNEKVAGKCQNGVAFFGFQKGCKKKKIFFSNQNFFNFKSSFLKVAVFFQPLYLYKYIYIIN